MAHFNNHFGTMRALRRQHFTGALRSVQRLLSRRFTQHIPDGGWHFSYVMTIDEMITKIKSFSHQEFNTPEFIDAKHIRDCIARGVDIFRTGATFKRIEIDDSFPEPVQQDPERFKAMIF